MNRTHLLTRPTSFPRAIRGVQANLDPAAALRDLTTAMTDFRARSDSRLTNVEASLDDLQASAAASRLGIGASGGAPVDAAYTELFASYIRRGSGVSELETANADGERAAVRAAMTEATPASGGYAAPVEWDRQIVRAQRVFSPMRQIAGQVTVDRAGFSTLWSDGAWGSGWVGETAARPQTTNPTMNPVLYPVGEIYAMPAITQNLLNDAAINLDSWVQEEAAEVFSYQEGIAFVSGDGVNKPQGLLTYAMGGAGATAHPGGALGESVSGSAAALTADGLVDFAYSLASPCRSNASWYMNSMSAAVIAKMKNAQGDYLWREALAQGQPATLLGYPVAIDENMPAIGAGAYPVAFGDFRRGYIIVDRLGMVLLRDPYTSKPFVLFYMTKRVGGGVRDVKAIRLLKVSA